MPEERSWKRRKLFARSLRKKLTDAEKRLWEALRGRRFQNFKFRRQVPIGQYVVDFLCMAHRLAIELDGSSHDRQVRKEYDENRDICLKERGYRILRFKNADIEDDLPSVLRRIEVHIFPPSEQNRNLPLSSRSSLMKQPCSPLLRNEEGEGIGVR